MRISTIMAPIKYISARSAPGMVGGRWSVVGDQCRWWSVVKHSGAASIQNPKIQNLKSKIQNPKSMRRLVLGEGFRIFVDVVREQAFLVVLWNQFDLLVFVG